MFLQSTPTFEPRWQRDAQPVTNYFQAALAHKTLSQHENELSLSLTRSDNASWGYHSVYTLVGLGEVLSVRTSTINRVTLSTICPSACLSLGYSFCFSSCISFCSSLLQSSPTFEPRRQRDAQNDTNQLQVAPAHITLGQHGNELSLSPTILNNASWGYHSKCTPVGLGEVLRVWSFPPNRVIFSTICVSACLSLCSRFCLSFQTSFRSSPLQSMSTLETITQTSNQGGKTVYDDNSSSSRRAPSSPKEKCVAGASSRVLVSEAPGWYLITSVNERGDQTCQIFPRIFVLL